MAALVSINGSALPTPSGYEVGIQDISKADRNVRGTMIKERIATKIKITVSYKYLSAASMASILQSLSTDFFSVTYLDPQTNTNKTGTFYSGDRNVSLMDFVGNQPRYQGASFNLIER